jgi:hypothetical protein
MSLFERLIRCCHQIPALELRHSLALGFLVFAADLDASGIETARLLVGKRGDAVRATPLIRKEDL